MQILGPRLRFTYPMTFVPRSGRIERTEYFWARIRLQFDALSLTRRQQHFGYGIRKSICTLSCSLEGSGTILKVLSARLQRSIY
jgi:hypothetical protein